MRRKSGELAHPLNVLLDCGLVVREPDGFYFNFFFSSRRRHTILTCDWSSDVCSSDLVCTISSAATPLAASSTRYPSSRKTPLVCALKIGRASCRERVEISVVAVSL